MSELRGLSLADLIEELMMVDAPTDFAVIEEAIRRLRELDAEVNHWVSMSNADWERFTKSPVRE